MSNAYLCLFVLSPLALLPSAVTADSVALEPLARAHAHNDYYHQRPLWDALERGFVSIEADVFLVDGQLLVGHYAHELRSERSLKSLYLDPLKRHVGAHDGRVFSNDQRLTLLVDFKTEGAAAYSALAKLLGEYGGLFTQWKGVQHVPGPIDVIVTGNRPIGEIAADPSRRVAIDGRKEDLAGEASADLIPLISESWANHFTWRGTGDMPAQERTRLEQLVAEAHQQGRRLRFWAAPDNPAAWAVQFEAGVDLIGADDLDGLQRLLQERQ
jgi:hypothetical protein